MGGLVVAALASVVVGFVAGGIASYVKERVTFGAVFGGIAAAILAFAIIAAASSYTLVEYGTVAVVTRFGAVTGEVFQPGLNWKTPFIEGTIVYRTRKLTYETAGDPGASDADYAD